ncbi:MAG: hypothetical protein LQ337_008063 [Flavoplaca oasis]|nr:MAG: hypothetical protein LQ337_008063 [Flavoplaca oasis]
MASPNPKGGPLVRIQEICEDDLPRAGMKQLTTKMCLPSGAGRAAHTDEPRVGENRALKVIEREAEGFLRELHQEDFFDNDMAFERRLDSVLAEIRSGVRYGIVRESKEHGAIGGIWHQTFAELEFGVRRAWRNARKCIMRSHSDELK